MAAAFTAAVQAGQLDLPLPGHGQTRERWAALADLAGEELSVARLARVTPTRWPSWPSWAPSHRRPEAAGACGPRSLPAPGSPPAGNDDSWWLDGIKQYCSGARSCTDALVTATAPDGNRLFAVSTRDLWPLPGTWRATGMAASDTLDVSFDGIEAEPLGVPGQLHRPARLRPRRGRGGRLLVRRGPGGRPDAA